MIMNASQKEQKQKTIDSLLGALTPEEKAGQLMVLGFNGTIADPETETFVARYNIGGLRISPYIRKFIRYLPDGAPGVENVLRPPRPGEKLWNDGVKPPSFRAAEYAGVLNGLRRLAMERRHAIPLHMVIDYESGEGSNYLPPGLLTLPAPMGFGRLDDPDLIRRALRAAGRQLKAMGVDQVHSPVVDVNTNPRNPEISTRSYSADTEVVIESARAALQGFAEAGIIATLKHYPGRGESANDSHHGLSAIKMDRAEFYRRHLAPYARLCAEGIVPAVMPGHSIYPMLDSSGEISTVSRPIITGILREEFGFDGVITTDSMTMGGLMARYTVGEAVVKAIEAGVDIVLLKDDNSLRYEAHAALAEAIRRGRISEERVNQSLRRIWSLKWDYGLFNNGGLARVEGLNEHLFHEDYQGVGREAARRAIHLLRDRAKILPLRPEQQILVIDRPSSNSTNANDYWNYPGVFWECLRRHSANVTYLDYQPKTVQTANGLIEQLAPAMDVLVVTAWYDRNSHDDTRQFLTGLLRYGKPVVMISNNPYEELVVPKEMDTVVVAYSLLRGSLEAASHYLYHGAPAQAKSGKSK